MSCMMVTSNVSIIATRSWSGDREFKHNNRSYGRALSADRRWFVSEFLTKYHMIIYSSPDGTSKDIPSALGPRTACNRPGAISNSISAISYDYLRYHYQYLPNYFIFINICMASLSSRPHPIVHPWAIANVKACRLLSELRFGNYKWLMTFIRWCWWLLQSSWSDVGWFHELSLKRINNTIRVFFRCLNVEKTQLGVRVQSALKGIFIVNWCKKTSSNANRFMPNNKNIHLIRNESI